MDANRINERTRKTIEKLRGKKKEGKTNEQKNSEFF